jgi:MinD-like ATPase involved in chromosome partitioning or flagellar assembly
METITFYSYKGGTGRSLAVANAARYLARLGFRVVAVDFDLEAPGLHYKFSGNPDGEPLKVRCGVADYIYGFVSEGRIPTSIKDFVLDVTVPGIIQPLLQLIPAGSVPSLDYWAKLSQINWHELFYHKESAGVQLFLELKARIADELQPDFLLIDSRTGITEMGGVATTILADRVICLVLPSRENLEGARAILRSLKRSQLELGNDLEIVVAVSRLPQMRDGIAEANVTERIRSILNEESEDLASTLSCQEIFVLHSEAALQVKETLSVGSGVSPDESILLRDYLRLFAKLVPRGLIEPRIAPLVQQAKEKIWDDPDAALREMEELAESFGHPDNYRVLLSFYNVRNVGGPAVLKRAQRLWELTGDSSDAAIWQIIKKNFSATAPWARRTHAGEWSPNLDFVEKVWRDAGNRDSEVGLKIADAYAYEDRPGRAADVLLETIKNAASFSPNAVARCVALLDTSDRSAEADLLIQQFKEVLNTEPAFLVAWARHAIRRDAKDGLRELATPPLIEALRAADSALAATIYLRAGFRTEANNVAEAGLRETLTRPDAERAIFPFGELFDSLGRWEEFEAVVRERLPGTTIDDLRRQRRVARRRK